MISIPNAIGSSVVTWRYISFTSLLNALSSKLPTRRDGNIVKSAHVGTEIVDIPNVAYSQLTPAAIVTFAAFLPLLMNATSGKSDSLFINSSVTRYHFVVPAACSYFTPLAIVTALLQSVGSTLADTALATNSTSAACIFSKSCGTSAMISSFERISFKSKSDVAVVGITVADTKKCFGCGNIAKRL